jgi:hypothetical protein
MLHFPAKPSHPGQLFHFNIIPQPTSKAEGVKFPIPSDANAQKEADVRFILESFSRFFPIILFAQHLAVRRDASSAQMPWGKVIPFHAIIFKGIIANRADSILPLESLRFHVVRKCTDAEVPLFAIQDVRIDPRFFGYPITIARLKGSYVKAVGKPP